MNGNYVRPIFSKENQKIQLVDSRHPCVEKQENINFISNTVELDRNQHRFQIITGKSFILIAFSPNISHFLGPNMGGKSTYIRQVRNINHS